MLTAAVRVPVEEGVKVTVMLQLPPTGRDVPQLLVWTKSLLFDPVTSIDATVRAALVAFRVDPCEALAIPTVWLPKLRSGGASEGSMDLRFHRAVTLVQLHPGGRGAGRGLLKLGAQRGELGRDAQAETAAAVAARIEPGGRRAEGGAGFLGQPDRPGPVDDRALAQLVADGRDDRNRQLGQPADLAGRDRLPQRDHAQDVTDARRALGQADCQRDLVRDRVNVHRPATSTRLALRYPPTSCPGWNRRAGTTSCGARRLSRRRCCTRLTRPAPLIRRCTIWAS